MWHAAIDYSEDMQEGWRIHCMYACICIASLSPMVTQGIGLSIDMGYDAGLRMQQLSKRGGMVVRDAVVAVNSERWICKCIFQILA